MRKKLMAFFLIVCLLMMYVPTAFAAVDNGLSVSKSSVKAGDTFEVSLAVPAIMGKKESVEFNISFDNTKFEVIAYTEPTISGAATSMGSSVSEATARGKITCTYLGINGDNTIDLSNGVVLTATMKALDAAKIGETAFEVTKYTTEGLAEDGHTSIDYTPQNVVKKATVSIYSEIIGEQPIDITAPVKGATPQTSIAEGSGYTGDLTWSSAVSSSPDGSFAGGIPYTAQVTLTAKDFYKFAADTTASVTGATVQNVRVAADGTTLTFDAVFPDTEDRELTGLEITTPPTTVDYVEGQSFDPAGMVVKATYDDGTEDNPFTGYTVENGNNLTTGTTNVTIKAGNQSAMQPITVVAKTITSIAVSGNFKKAYTIGDAADWTGMVVTAAYNDGTTAALAENAYTVTGFDSSAAAATQTITVTAEGKTETFTISIAKKAPTANDFTVTLPTDAVYDGTAKAVTVAAGDSITGMGAITVKYNGSVDAPVNAGSYAITIDVAEGDSYQAATGLAAGTLVIAKATPVITVDSSKTVVIGNTVVLGASIEPIGLDLTYSSADTSKVSVDAAGKVKGEALTNTPVAVTVFFAGNDNYNAVSATVNVTVTAKIPVTVTFADATAQTYNPEGYALGSQFSAATCDAGAVKYYYNDKEYANLDALKAVTVAEAGTYMVQAVYDDDTRYGMAEASFTINKADQTALTVNSATVQFGQTLSLSTTGGSGTGEVTYTVTDGTGKATVAGNVLTPAQAGEVTVVATKAADNNYNAATSAATTITITKANALTLADKEISQKIGTTASAYAYVTDVMPPNAGKSTYTTGTAVDAKGILQDCSVDTNGQVTYTLAAERAVGDTVTLPITIHSDNYEDSTVNVVITVTDKDTQAALTVDCAKTMTYGQTLQLASKGGSGSGAVTYTVTNGTGKATVAGNVLTALQAGTVTVQAAKAEDADYSAQTSDAVTITIDKAVPTGAPVYDAITVAGKTLADAHLAIGSITTSGAISWKLDAATAVEANTSYDWIFTPDDAVNYKGLTDSVVLWQQDPVKPVDPQPSCPSGGGGFSGTYNYPVKVDSTGDATVTFDKNNAVAGDNVTITVQPKSGKAVDEVIVTDADNKALTVTKTGDNKYSFTMPKGEVKVSVTTKAATYDKRIVLQINNRNVLIDSATLTNDVAPVIVDDRTMVPIRVVTEALGGKADWNAATQTVTLTIDGNVLRMTIGQIIPGFDVAPVIINDRTYVPIRYVAEKLGANVEWIAASQQIIIEK